MKRCFKCGEHKPLNDYYRHPRMADGHLNKCKDCTKADTIQWQKDKPGAYAAKQKAWRDRNPDKVREYASHQPKHRRAAQSRVAYALRTGRLTRAEACENCGVIGKKLDAHHDDYDKPLEVRWLCRTCHRNHHRQETPR